MARIAQRSLIVTLWMIAAGCNLNRFAANSAAGIAAQSTDYMGGFWDHEIARAGTAAAIMQLESLHSISPDNESLTLTLVASYVGHGFGWVELDSERARFEHHFDQSDRLRARAELIYRRARDLALSTMRRRDSGIDALLLGQPEPLRAYLEAHYRDAQDDMAPVFWTAMAWGSMLNMTDEMDQAVDLPLIRVLAEHVAKYNPGFQSASPLVFLGGLYSQMPAAYGGDPAKGKAYFERALLLTQRKSHVVQLNYAKLYASTVGDKKLFHALLDEIIAPEDRGSAVRLSNKIARMHAELLLQSEASNP